MQHSQNYDYKKQRYEKNTQPSKTVPDMAMSPKEILMKFRAGAPLPHREGYYDGEDEYYPDLAKMDITEINDLIAQNKEEIQDLELEIRSRKAAEDAQKLVNNEQKTDAE